MDDIRALIRAVPDFPSPGVVFRDITPLLRDARALSRVVAAFADRYRESGIDVVAGIESRGFLFGAPVAVALQAGFVPIRKMGKLPGRTIHRAYELEYGSNHLEIQADALERGQRVLLLDDVLATGGTAGSSVELIRELGAVVVGAAFAIELDALRGRAAIADVEVFSLLHF